MALLDSSCWLEYFMDGPNAGQYAELIEAAEPLIVPAIVLHEVFKVIMRASDEGTALMAAGTLQQHQLVSIDANIAMYAAKLGQQHGLAMADSLILATAQIHDATLWTQDADFKGLPNVRYLETKNG
ncbi:MAG: type II toxin-antitoxin system VapC family toxin [Mariprofundaceae bacterium]